MFFCVFFCSTSYHLKGREVCAGPSEGPGGAGCSCAGQQGEMTRGTIANAPCVALALSSGARLLRRAGGVDLAFPMCPVRSAYYRLFSALESAEVGRREGVRVGAGGRGEGEDFAVTFSRAFSALLTFFFSAIMAGARAATGTGVRGGEGRGGRRMLAVSFPTSP